jgi:hypothetical protein
VAIEIADWCFGGLGCWGSSAPRGDDGHGDDPPACGGGVCWAAFADVRLDSDGELSCFKLWLRWRVFDGRLTGCAEPRAGGVRVVAGRVVLARMVLARVAAW